MRTVLLSVGYEPMKIISWYQAFVLVWEGKATLLWAYPDKKIRSSTLAFEWPAIIALNYYVKPQKLKIISPGTRAILTRDKYTCQYCGIKLTNKTGTKDHIIPESKGGPSTWENLVASCKRCQEKKGNLMPDVCKMYPKLKPKSPNQREKFILTLWTASGIERKTWVAGFKKLGLDYLIQDKELL